MFSEPVLNFNNKSDKKLHTSNILPKNEVNINKEINYKNREFYSKSTYTTPIISINGYLENYYKNLLNKNSFCDNSIDKNRNCRYCDTFKLPNDNYIGEKNKLSSLPINKSNWWNEINQRWRKGVMVYNTYIEVEKPLNLMNDPRVFRGSVIAKQREYQREKRENERRRLEELRFKTNMLRSKLEQSFREQNSHSQNINGIDYYKKDDYSLSQHNKINTLKNLPKLNGPLGITRRFFNIEERIPYNEMYKGKVHRDDEDEVSNNIGEKMYRRPRKFDRSRSGKSKLLPLRKEVGNRSLSAEYGKIQQLRKENYSLNKYNPDFTSVKFVPIENDPRFRKDVKSSGDIITKVVPTIFSNDKNNDPYYNSQKHKRTLVDLSKVPHNSVSTPPSYVDTEVQTQEDIEEYLTSICSELSINAISNAIYNLKSDDEIEKLKNDKIIIKNNLIKEKEKLVDLEKIIHDKESTEEELLRQRDKMKHLIKLLESRKMAYFTVNDVIENSISNLLDHDLIKEIPKYKSVANDTTDLVKRNKLYKMNFKEIEFDFMPWIINRAEKIAFQRRAERELREAMFSKHSVVRNEAKKALREFIKDAEKLHYKPYKF